MRTWKCDDAAADVALLVSELVTNAVLHARSRAQLTMQLTGTVVRVSVHDENRTPPRRRPYTPESVTGRGLLLVDRLADRWGVTDEPDGKSVWFELDAHAASAASRPDGHRAGPP
jgi:anti-sigma regulatory factor (Ser/Thr protein kinase)